MKSVSVFNPVGRMMSGKFEEGEKKKEKGWTGVWNNEGHLFSRVSLFFCYAPEQEFCAYNLLARLSTFKLDLDEVGGRRRDEIPILRPSGLPRLVPHPNGRPIEIGIVTSFHLRLIMFFFWFSLPSFTFFSFLSPTAHHHQSSVKTKLLAQHVARQLISAPAAPSPTDVTHVNNNVC